MSTKIRQPEHVSMDTEPVIVTDVERAGGGKFQHNTSAPITSALSIKVMVLLFAIFSIPVGTMVILAIANVIQK